MEGPLKKRGSGLLVVLTVIVALGTIVQDYRFNSSIATAQASVVAVDRELGQIDLALADLRAAQAGYVAAGQGPDFWMGRASELATAIQTSLQTVRDATPSVEARARYDAANRHLSELTSIDARAREQVGDEQRLFASDLIFMDSLAPGTRLADELEQARAAELAAGTDRIERYAQLRLGMNALALGFVLVVMVYFARAGGSEDPAAGEAGLAIARGAYATQPSTDRPSRADRPDRMEPSAPAPLPGRAAAPSIAPPLPKAEPAVSLSGAADLCVDLARLMDGRDLQDLMERAAKVLYAKGIVLWMADQDGRSLRPTLAHGYSDKVLARLGTLEVDADNVTSLAFRTLQPQKMKSTERGGTGAVAVPLITSSGGVGVLSAEIRSATPDDQMLAIARIVAAQLSSVVAPAEAPATAATETAARAAAEG
jgi:hypothetical protein